MAKWQLEKEELAEIARQLVVPPSDHYQWRQYRYRYLVSMPGKKPEHVLVHGQGAISHELAVMQAEALVLVDGRTGQPIPRQHYALVMLEADSGSQFFYERRSWVAQLKDEKEK